MSLMTEALRQVVEAQETAARVPPPRPPSTRRAGRGAGDESSRDARVPEENITDGGAQQHPPAYAHALKFFAQHWDPRRLALRRWAKSARGGNHRREQRAWAAKALSSFVMKWKNLAMVPAFKSWWGVVVSLRVSVWYPGER
jgi:hypothetical protein